MTDSTISDWIDNNIPGGAAAQMDWEMKLVLAKLLLDDLNRIPRQRFIQAMLALELTEMAESFQAMPEETR